MRKENFMEEKMVNQEEELELNGEQAARNDEIYNGVFDLCRLMAEKPELEWNMGFIGEIADCVASILARHGIRVRFPAVVTEEDGTQHIEEYCEAD